jgi:hypothetical protein
MCMHRYYHVSVKIIHGSCGYKKVFCSLECDALWWDRLRKVKQPPGSECTFFWLSAAAADHWNDAANSWVSWSATCW